MDKLSSEQKLALVNQVRTRYQQDRYDLKERERIIHPDNINVDAFTPGEDTAFTAKPSFTGLRLLISFTMMILIILSDRKDVPFFGMDSDTFFELLDRDYYEMAEQFFSKP